MLILACQHNRSAFPFPRQAAGAERGTGGTGNHFSPTIWNPSEMAGQVRRWSRERLQFVLWFSKKLEPKIYKKSGVLSCPVCHARGYPVLQRSCDFVGEVLWACPECATPICPAEKAAKANKKRRSHRPPHQTKAEGPAVPSGPAGPSAGLQKIFRAAGTVSLRLNLSRRNVPLRRPHCFSHPSSILRSSSSKGRRPLRAS